MAIITNEELGAGAVLNPPFPSETEFAAERERDPGFAGVFGGFLQRENIFFNRPAQLRREFAPPLGEDVDISLNPLQGLDTATVGKYGHELLQFDKLSERDAFIQYNLEVEQLMGAAAEHPVAAFFGGVSGAILSPESWVIGGNALKIRSAIRGIGLVKVLRGAVVGAGTVTMSELILRDMQGTARSEEESFYNIIGGTIFSGGLSGIAHVFSKAQMEALEAMTKAETLHYFSGDGSLSASVVRDVGDMKGFTEVQAVSEILEKLKERDFEAYKALRPGGLLGRWLLKSMSFTLDGHLALSESVTARTFLRLTLASSFVIEGGQKILVTPVQSSITNSLGRAGLALRKYNDAYTGYVKSVGSKVALERPEFFRHWARVLAGGDEILEQVPETARAAIKKSRDEHRKFTTDTGGDLKEEFLLPDQTTPGAGPSETAVDLFPVVIDEVNFIDDAVEIQRVLRNWLIKQGDEVADVNKKILYQNYLKNPNVNVSLTTRGVSGLQGSLARRSVLIPQLEMLDRGFERGRPWFQTDPTLVMATYIRKVIPQLEFARRFKTSRSVHFTGGVFRKTWDAAKLASSEGNSQPMRDFLQDAPVIDAINILDAVKLEAPSTVARSLDDQLGQRSALRGRLRKSPGDEELLGEIGAVQELIDENLKVAKAHDKDLVSGAKEFTSSRLDDLEELGEQKEFGADLTDDEAVELFTDAQDLFNLVGLRESRRAIELVTFTNVNGPLGRDYEVLTGAKPEKANFFNKKKKQNLNAIIGTRDRLLGRAASMNTDPSTDIVGTTLRILRRFNFMSKMGGVLISSIPDMAGAIMNEGFTPYIKALHFRLSADYKKFLAGANENDLLRVIGQLEYLQMTARNKMHIDGYAGAVATDKLSLWTDRVSEGFATLTGINAWNRAHKQIGALVVYNNIIDDAFKMRAGKRLKESRRAIYRSEGVSNDMLKNFADQYDIHGTNMDAGGQRIPDSALWDPDVAEAFNSFVLQRVEKIIVTPGVQDIPFLGGKFLDDEWLRTFLQFKSFAIASTNKTLINATQRALGARDLNVVSGFMMMATLGYMTSITKGWIAGRGFPDDQNIGDIVFEAIDRSGLLAVPLELNNISGKTTGLSINRLFSDRPASRYISRNWADAVAGPSFGWLEDARQAVLGVTRGPFTQTTVKAAERLFPGQNLPHFQIPMELIKEGGFDAIVGDVFNLPRTAREARAR